MIRSFSICIYRIDIDIKILPNQMDDKGPHPTILIDITNYLIICLGILICPSVSYRQNHLQIDGFLHHRKVFS